jgi:hypothetical protein
MNNTTQDEVNEITYSIQAPKGQQGYTLEETEEYIITYFSHCSMFAQTF